MATETKYKFYGSKNRLGDKTRSIILEGTSSNPEKTLDRDGEAIALNDEQVAHLRNQGWVIRKVNEKGDPEEDSEETQTKEEQQEAQKPPAGSIENTPTADAAKKQRAGN